MKANRKRTELLTIASEMREAAAAIEDMCGDMEEADLDSFSLQSTTALGRYWPGIKDWVSKAHGRLQAHLVRKHIGA